MKYSLPIVSIIALLSTSSAFAHPEQTPTDTTAHEMLSPHQHAELYLNLVSHLYYALIPLQDSVIDEASAAAARGKILALHRRLNLAIDHMVHNPDMRNEVLNILRNDPQRLKRMLHEQDTYHRSASRCRATGLIPDMPTIRRVTIPADALSSGS